MKNILTFVAGAAVGTLVSWAYHKNKYEHKMQEEVKSLRTHVKQKERERVENIDTDTELDTAMDIINGNGYLNDNSMSEENSNIFDRSRKPFILKPDQFGNMRGFDSDSFYYYKDDIIANGYHQIVEDMDSLFGMTMDEIKDQFGVYDDNVVYIRNMQLECDYEILLDEENFTQRNDNNG